MKLLMITCLFFSVASFAATEEVQTFEKNEKLMLWPRLTVWPTGVDLNINNHTMDDYSCSGMIYINHRSRRVTTEYYFNRVYARSFAQRHFFNRFYNDRIVSAYHNIFCHRL